LDDPMVPTSFASAGCVTWERCLMRWTSRGGKR